jgi:hypothetical protein
MGFTTPKTWSSGETLTAANFNTYIRDNQLSFGPHLIVRKTSDEAQSSNTALQNDSNLQLSVAANEIWHVQYNLKTTIPITPQMKMAFTFPSGGEVNLCGTEFNAAGTLTKITFQGTTTPTATQDFLGSSVNRHIVIEGVFVNGSTAGTLILQWAQNVSNASATIMKANSTLWAVKLA